MKNLLFISIFVVASYATQAQIGIGTATPNASAALDVSSSSNNKGMLIPRMTAA